MTSVSRSRRQPKWTSTTTFAVCSSPCVSVATIATAVERSPAPRWAPATDTFSGCMIAKTASKKLRTSAAIVKARGVVGTMSRGSLPSSRSSSRSISIARLDVSRICSASSAIGAPVEDVASGSAAARACPVAATDWVDVGRAAMGSGAGLGPPRLPNDLVAAAPRIGRKMPPPVEEDVNPHFQEGVSVDVTSNCLTRSDQRSRQQSACGAGRGPTTRRGGLPIGCGSGAGYSYSVPIAPVTAAWHAHQVKHNDSSSVGRFSIVMRSVFEPEQMGRDAWRIASWLWRRLSPQ